MIPIILMIVAILACVLLACILEYRDFNHGRCRRCGNRLRLFDIDSQGGRGYVCDTCRYSTWVSYGIVDGKFKEEEK